MRLGSCLSEVLMSGTISVLNSTLLAFANPTTDVALDRKARCIRKIARRAQQLPNLDGFMLDLDVLDIELRHVNVRRTPFANRVAGECIPVDTRIHEEHA